MEATPLHASVAVAIPVLLVAMESPQRRNLLVGQVMAGGFVSAMVMCCRQLLSRPQASLAVQVRSMPGRPVQLGGVGASLKVIVTGWLKLPVIVAVPVAFVPVGSPQF